MSATGRQNALVEEGAVGTSPLLAGHLGADLVALLQRARLADLLAHFGSLPGLRLLFLNPLLGRVFGVLELLPPQEATIQVGPA